MSFIRDHFGGEHRTAGLGRTAAALCLSCAAILMVTPYGAYAGGDEPCACSSCHAAEDQSLPFETPWQDCLTQGGPPSGCRYFVEYQLYHGVHVPGGGQRGGPAGGVPGRDPNHPPADCELFCEFEAQNVFNDCVESGEEFLQCSFLADDFLTGCTQGCAPPTDNCTMDCDQSAQEAFDQCMIDTGSPFGCSVVAGRIFDECIVNECLSQPPCEAICSENAEAFLDECLADGNAASQCQLLAEQFVEDCLAQNCHGTVIEDFAGDSVARHTHQGDLGLFQPSPENLIDLLSVKVGTWASSGDSDHARFEGEFSPNGHYFRLDLVFAGLVNPPGPASANFGFPQQYGLRPLYGFVEFDMDNNRATGGEVEHPELRYQGNVSRFGGKPDAERFNNVVAEEGAHLDHNLLTPPFVERSGEEFHLALLGHLMSNASIVVADGDQDTLFEAGETWLIGGRFLHRAHAFEPFSAAMGGFQGEYNPPTTLRFSHDENEDVTVVSLVFPLYSDEIINVDPGGGSGGLNGNPNDGASIYEALWDLWLSANFLLGFPPVAPGQDLLNDWAFEDPAAYLVPEHWDLTVLVGTSLMANGAVLDGHIWTDVLPNVVPGDLDGSGHADDLDVALMLARMRENDEQDQTDDLSYAIPGFAEDFQVCDLNYDGIVGPADLALLEQLSAGGPDTPGTGEIVQSRPGFTGLSRRPPGGEMGVDLDLNGDGLVNALDYRFLPEAFQPGGEGPGGVQGGAIPGDADSDGDVDLADFAQMQRCLSPNLSSLNNEACKYFNAAGPEDGESIDLLTFVTLMGGPT